jgi:hypothetical protein
VREDDLNAGRILRVSGSSTPMILGDPQAPLPMLDISSQDCQYRN